MRSMDLLLKHSASLEAVTEVRLQVLLITRLLVSFTLLLAPPSKERTERYEEEEWRLQSHIRSAVQSGKTFPVR